MIDEASFLFHSDFQNMIRSLLWFWYRWLVLLQRETAACLLLIVSPMEMEMMIVARGLMDTGGITTQRAVQLADVSRGKKHRDGCLLLSRNAGATNGISPNPVTGSGSVGCAIRRLG